MRVFDVPAGVGLDDRPMRIVAHGTCRVNGPFEALATRKRIFRVWANEVANSYTFGEARQMLAHCVGDSPIPTSLQPFIFQDPADAPLPDSSHRRMIEGADVFLFEICELRQIRYKNYYFQIQSFIKNFLSKHGSAVLPWYRALSRDGLVTKDLVADAMSKLSHLPGEEQELTESILRETQIEISDVASGTRMVSEMVGEAPWRWTLVPHFMIPGLSGNMMNDREKVRQVVSEVARSCGARYFDPSALVAAHGREKALDNGGKDPYHYSSAFSATMGRALLREPIATLVDHTPASPPGGTVPSALSNVGLVGGGLNSVLISLHRERVARLGVDGSGLHEHYAAMLERRTVLRPSDLAIAEVIVNLLPRFERYDVLRSGLGEIAFLLSAFGCKTMAFDPSEARLRAVEAGIAHLRDCQFPNSDLLGSALMMVPERTGPERALAVACQLLFALPLKEEEVMMSRLEKYEAVLFHPAALLRRRSPGAEQEALLERFRRAGFVHVRDFPHLRLVCCAKESMHVHDAVSGIQPPQEDETRGVKELSLP